MLYTFRIEETATYTQFGTVLVDADSREEAERKLKNSSANIRDQWHTGDNEIDYNSQRNVHLDATEFLD